MEQIDKSKIKLIAADIDGTITRSDYTTTKRNIEAIQSLRNKGYLFGLASGRPVNDILDRYQLWGLKDQFDFIIGWNGCELYDNKTKQTHKYNSIKKEELKEIVELMLPFDTTISMYLPGVVIANKETEKIIFSAEKTKRKYIITDKFEDFYQVDNSGIMFRTTIQKMPEVEKVVNEYTKDKNYFGFKTQKDLLEFANKNSNKGYALKQLCKLYNLELDECMAFGDTTNDNQLLKVCNGVCMLNGSDDTKACAKYITEIACDDDGFADFVEKYLL